MLTDEQIARLQLYWQTLVRLTNGQQVAAWVPTQPSTSRQPAAIQ